MVWMPSAEYRICVPSGVQAIGLWLLTVLVIGLALVPSAEATQSLPVLVAKATWRVSGEYLIWVTVVVAGSKPPPVGVMVCCWWVLMSTVVQSGVAPVAKAATQAAADSAAPIRAGMLMGIQTPPEGREPGADEHTQAPAIPFNQRPRTLIHHPKHSLESASSGGRPTPYR